MDMKRKAAIAAALMIVLTTAPAVSADESKQVYDPDKPVWTTSSEMTSSESTSDGAFTLSGNYGTVEYGSGKSLIVKLTSNSGTASVTGVTVQRKTSGKWVTAAKKNGGKLTSTSNSAAKGQSITFTFTPDLYFAKAVPGDHRLAFTITDGSGSSRNIYYVFNIVNNAEVTTDQASYDLMNTDTIRFTARLNTECELYPQVNELYYYENKKWVLVLPKKSALVSTDTKTVESGSTFESTLDLTRYNHNRMKSGKYKAVLGDDVSVEFTMYRPIDIKGTQVQSNGTTIRFVFTNKSNSAAKITAISALWYAEPSSGKWRALSPVGSTSYSLSVSKGKHKTRDVSVSDMYGKLKRGSYRMQVTMDDGTEVYGYFNVIE